MDWIRINTLLSVILQAASAGSRFTEFASLAELELGTTLKKYKETSAPAGSGSRLDPVTPTATTPTTVP